MVSTTGIGRKSRVYTQAIGDPPPVPVGTPNPNGPCRNSDGTPCKDIGHVTAHHDASDIITYARVYLIGGATALEFLSAAAAVLSIADWAAMLLTLGISVGVTYVIMKCAVDAYPRTT